ncbi:MAG: peptidase [Spirochaetaceae bacterium]|nr:MAG: peptidase [Spirochaetaceae bacterium]
MTINLLLVLLLAGGWVGGRLFSRVRLPSVLGMLLVGVAAGPLVRAYAPPLFGDLSPMLRSMALVVILLRAGLGIRTSALKRSGVTALLLAVVPCLLEGGVLMLVFRHFWGFEWVSAGAAAFLLAAVSPAVVVPSMIVLMEGGYGKRNEVPTTILAGASVDDVIAITLFTVFVNAAGDSTAEVGLALASIPLQIVGAVVAGGVVGFVLAWWFRRHAESIRATEKFLLLVAAAIMLVEIGHAVHLAALLGVMTVGFVLLERAESVAHELAGKLGKAWVIAEIVLFVLIGTAVNPEHALSVGLAGVATIAVGLVARSVGVLLATLFSGFSAGERLFCVFSYLPKATVQAALGAVPLSIGMAGGEVILSVAVLAILLTAPLGLWLIRTFGTGLLGAPLPADDEEGAALAE